MKKVIKRIHNISTMKLLGICIIGILVLTLNGCSPMVGLTNGAIEQYDLSDEELHRIQYYISTELMLTRGNREGSTETNKGEVIVKNEDNIDQIRIKKNTPGILIDNREKGIVGISFEEGDDRVLYFKPRYLNGKYTLQSVTAQNNKEYVDYAGQKYYISNSSLNTYIKFKVKKVKKIKREQRVVGGRKIK